MCAEADAKIKFLRDRLPAKDRARDKRRAIDRMHLTVGGFPGGTPPAGDAQRWADREDSWLLVV